MVNIVLTSVFKVCPVCIQTKKQKQKDWITLEDFSFSRVYFVNVHLYFKKIKKVIFYFIIKCAMSSCTFKWMDMVSKKETYYKGRGACVSVQGQMSLHHFNFNINHVISDTAGGCWILWGAFNWFMLINTLEITNTQTNVGYNDDLCFHRCVQYWFHIYIWKKFCSLY